MSLIYYFPFTDSLSPSVGEGVSLSLVGTERTSTAPSFSPGIFEGAAYFGKNQFTHFSSSSVILDPPFSVSFWVNVSESDSSYADIITSRNQTAQTPQSGWSLFVDNKVSTTLTYGAVLRGVKDGVSSDQFVSNVPLVTGAWNLAVITSDPSGETKLYIGNALFYTLNKYIRFPLFNSGGVNWAYIGDEWQDGIAQGWSDFAVHDVVLTSQQVTQLWNGGDGLRASALPPLLESVPQSDPPRYFHMDLSAEGVAAVRMPISSWQATLQADRAAYAQAVVPSALQWMDAISERTGGEFSIIAEDADGNETTIVTAPLQTFQFNQGPTNATVSISGYFTGSVVAADQRTVRNVRSKALTPLRRIRCDLDSSLRPGQIVALDGDQFVVSYINMYVNASDRYMDVGERA